MEFVNLSELEFNEFMKKQKTCDFLQSPKMDQLERTKGWDIEYVGIKDNKKIKCATKLMSRNTRFKKKYYYAPSGFLIDYNDLSLLQEFTINLKKYIKSKNGYVLHIDPKIINKERDSEGKIVEGGIDNTDLINNLKKLGYEHEGFNTEYDLNKQMRWVFVKDIEGKNEQDILKEMKPNTRNLINKAIKYGLKVKELSFEELPLFKEVTLATSKRRNFKDKPLEYYETMYKIFNKDKEIKFLSCELNIKEYKKNLENELKSEEEKYNKMSSNSGKKKEELITINGLKKRIEEAQVMYKEHGDNIILSVAMFMCFSSTVYYYFSGSDYRYMNFNAQYLIQYEMLKYAVENNFKIYNFLGIKGNFDKNDEDYGVYKFKKSFGGHVEEYIGDFNLPITPMYKLSKIIKKLR
ncbi:MAG: peptidoglycan bridge formation glycyltransferase FemA/FemB family protein [Bacilli bacterium]|nr:peptidoglycan bridge formation glycyltransferase FemA/FemB family protein [Bacilli bacterium]